MRRRRLLTHYSIGVYRYVYGSGLLVDILCSYIAVSTRVRREVVEKAKRLGNSISEFLRRKLKEKVEGGGGVDH